MKVTLTGSPAEITSLLRRLSGRGHEREESEERRTEIREPRKAEAPKVAETSGSTKTPQTLAQSTGSLPSLSPHVRESAWRLFSDLCRNWVEGFGDPKAPQPDRLGLLQQCGSGGYAVPILVMAYEKESLQRLVEAALEECGYRQVLEPISQEHWLDQVDLIAANMVQVSHMGFPDLAGTYDYTQKWREE